MIWLYVHDLWLTPPNWIWLRGVDRTLFYALHRANTTKGFIEGAGVAAVARAEAEAMRFGLPCPEPCVDEAVEDLRRDMLSLGPIWDESQPGCDRERRTLTGWSLADDILSRTPVTDNEFQLSGELKMTIEYFVTCIAKHISMQAIWPDGRTKIIAALPRDALSGLVIRNNQLIHIAFDAMGIRNKETALTDKQERNADQILTAIDSCPRPEYLIERRPSKTPLFRGTIVSAMLFVVVTIGFPLFCYVDRVFWDGTTPEAVQTVGEPRLLPPHLNHTVSLNEGIQLPVSPKRDVQVPEKTITSKNPEAVAVRHNLVTVLKWNVDRGMFAINPSPGHERTLFAFLDPACPNCRLLEPALKCLASDFNVVIHPVSIIGGEESTDHVALPLCEKDAQKRVAGWHRLYSADNGMTMPSEEITPVDETCLKAARTATDVNSVAFRRSGFADTPWVLSDTGWYLPTRILQEAGTLNLFLKTTDSEPDYE